MSPTNNEYKSLLRDVIDIYNTATPFSNSDIHISIVYYEISGVCNAKCPYCPTGSGSTKGRPLRFIPPEEFSRGLNRLYELNLLDSETFFGLYNWGDPLLHPQLDEILTTLKEADQSFALSSNGSTVPNNLNSSLLDNLSWFRISLPGFSQKSYNKIHQLNFEKVLHNIDLLNELVPPNTLEVGIFAYKFNIEEIPRACEYFNKKNIRFQVIIPHLMDHKDTIDYLTESIDPIKKQKIEEDLFTDYIKPLLLERETKDFCSFLQNQIVIDEYNNVLTCCILSKNSEYYSIGSLFELTKEDLFDIKIRGSPICRQCISAGVPYWYSNSHKNLPQVLQKYNTLTYCYINTGKGFSENQKISYNINPTLSKTPFRISFNLKNFFGIESLRWDPIEGQLCSVQVDKIKIEMKNGEVQFIEPATLVTNGYRNPDNEFRFNSVDPWILIQARGAIKNVAISGSWHFKDVSETISSLNQEIIQIIERDKLFHLSVEECEEKAASSDILNQRQVQQLAELSNELASIKHSIVWRLLMKFQTGIVDKVLPPTTRSREIYNLFLKGNQTLINEGVAGYWRKINAYKISREKRKEKREIEYFEWIIENEPSTTDLLEQKKEAQTFHYSPKISIITPVYNIRPDILRSTLYSVIDQTYENWELCIVDGNSENPEVKDLLKKFADDDPRIFVTFLDQNQGISGNSNVALSMATGEFVLFLDHDDMLAPFALFEIVKLLNENQSLDLIYSDRDLLSEDSNHRYNPLFKPDWSPEIMLSTNYLAHLCVIRRNILDNIGNFNTDLDGAQDWDLFLRVTEKTDKISHIPKILYHWRCIQTSCAIRGENAKPYIIDAQKSAIESHLKRCHKNGRVTFRQPGVWHIEWDLLTEKFVSIIIPTQNISLLKNCLDSIFTFTNYHYYEIIVIDTGLDTSVDPGFIEKISNLPNVKIIEYKNTFNYSVVNNIGSRHAEGEFLLFLNDDIKVISPDWLLEMVSWAIQDKIGVVGAKLLFPGGTIQHAGVVLGLTGFAGHLFAGCAEHTMGIFGSTDWYRDYYAVTGACMMVRREIFNEVGGFDESFILCGSDIEFCLRVNNRGYRIIYNPFAVVEHLESASRGRDIPDNDFDISYHHYLPFILKGDPHFNPNLSYWSLMPMLRNSGEIDALNYICESVK